MNLAAGRAAALEAQEEMSKWQQILTTLADQARAHPAPSAVELLSRLDYLDNLHDAGLNAPDQLALDLAMTETVDALAGKLRRWGVIE